MKRMDFFASELSHLLLIIGGFIAGFIDSIAGGGGLITLPLLSAAVGPGAHAIGTNKIVGTTGAAIAFWVYLRGSKLHLKTGASFLLSVTFGSFLGSLTAPQIPVRFFQIFLITLCPVVLFVLWKKESFVRTPTISELKRNPVAIVFVGFLAGFYDGFFGPGGGTFMLLGLLWGAGLPLLESLLLSKLSNTLSASTSLASYSLQGFVHVREGLMMASGMLVGSFLGARMASKKAEKVVRPALVTVVTLLLLIQLKNVLQS